MSVAERMQVGKPHSHKGRARPRFSDRVLADIASVIDAIVIFSAGCLAHIFYFTFFASGSWQLSLTAAFLGAAFAIILFRRQGLYELRRLVRWWERLGRLAASWTIVFFGLVTIGFLVKAAESYSRGWALTWFAMTLGCLVIGRAVMGIVLQRMVKEGRLHRRIAIVGSGEQSRLLIDSLAAKGELVDIVGVYGIEPDWTEDGPPVVPQQGALDDLIEAAQSQRVDDIVLALSRTNEQRIWAITDKLASLPVNIRLSPETFDIKSGKAKEELVGAVKTTVLLTPPLSGWSRIVKGLEDRILSALLLLFVSPAMALVALAIKLDTPGPVFFIQRRHGFNHEIIPVWKFRTMHVREDGPEITQATRDDARITRVGKFLRRTSLDELPQIFNVLRGEMSLVGPRPHAMAHNLQYASMISSYSKRHRVKPGITGWAQINGFRGETRDPALMEKRIEFDLFYIENWTLWFDVKIILLTPLRGLIHPNAY